jgi:hypothetical protein
MVIVTVLAPSALGEGSSYNSFPAVVNPGVLHLLLNGPFVEHFSVTPFVGCLVLLES